MRIFVTGHSSRAGGSISVAQNLIAAFGRVAPQNQYKITIPPDLGFENRCLSIPFCTVVPYRTTSLPGRWWWEAYKLPQIIRNFQPDVIFNFANRGLISPPCPQATLIQDSHLFYPFSHFGPISAIEWLTFRYHRQHLKRSLRDTKVFFCQTTVAARRFRATYGKDLDIQVCPNQVSGLIETTSEGCAEPHALWGHQERFKLFVLSRYYTHKNLEIIPALFERYSDDLRDVVIITTMSADQHRNAARLLERVKPITNIINVGPLQQQELAAYYKHIDALFLPTLLESFSGTYVEAMQFGKPILTSDMDFAHAVCGGAALYFDPRNVDSICEAILRLKTNHALYNRLSQAGEKRPQVQSMSWDDIALSVIQKLESIASH